MEESQLNEYYKQLKRLFYLFLFSSVMQLLFAFLFRILKIEMADISPSFVLNIKTILFIGVLLGIPGIYYYFSKQTKRLKKAALTEEKRKLYRTMYLTKLIVLESFIFLSLIAYVLTSDKNIFYIMLFVLLVLVLNFPSKTTILNDFNENEK